MLQIFTSCHESITDQLWYGVRLLAEKQATNYGDGEALISFMRDSIGEYHLVGKVRTSTFFFQKLQSCVQMKYRRGCIWTVLQSEGVFGEKIARDCVWNRLINNKGSPNTPFVVWFSLDNFLIAVSRSEGHECGGRLGGWTCQPRLQGQCWKKMIWFFLQRIPTKMIFIQEILDNLKGNYDEERIATMAVSIDIKKELEAKLHPTYASR